jgi:hypothetical protein
MRRNQGSGSVGHSKHRKAFGKGTGDMRACAEWLNRQARKIRQSKMYGSVAELMRAERRRGR